MTIAELGSLGEFVASFGVLITLIYLVIQLRQNTKAIRLNTTISVTEELQDMFGLMASDEGLAEVFAEAAQNEKLAGARGVRFYTLMSNLLRVYENAHLQNCEQAVNADHWAGLTRMMIDITDIAAFPNYWEDRKHWFSDDFQRHMDTGIIPVAKKAGTNIPGNYLK